MGFFDKEVKNSFDRMFDLNEDGLLDPTEQQLQISYLEGIGLEMNADDELDDEDFEYVSLAEN